MKKIIPIVLFFLFPNLAFSQGYTLFSDIPYNTISGVNQNLKSLDIYSPNDISGTCPVIVYIHGGAWSGGDKKNVGAKADFFSRHGFVFVSINYRLSPDPPDTTAPHAVRFPIHPSDCADAIRFVFDNIDQYHGDSSRVGLIGHSAGAHLVLLLSTNERFLQSVDLSLENIKCTCSLDAGVFDLADEFKFATNNQSRRMMLFNAFGNNTSLYSDASPQNQIQPGKDFPPFLLIHQNKTKRIYSHTRFADSLKTSGYEKTTLFNAEPYDHSMINRLLGNERLDTIGETDSVMHFFSKYLSIPEQTELFKLVSIHSHTMGQSTIILDTDNDERLDVITANKGMIHLIHNKGSMKFRHLASQTVFRANGFGLHDFNGDGLMDFMIAQSGDGSNVDVRLNRGNNTFALRDLGNESIGPVRNIVFADFDLDGLIDSYHSASAFGTNHHGNQLHSGIPGGRFGPDIIEKILEPPIADFWYDTLTHPSYGNVKWSNIQSKAAFARDFDGDGRPDLLTCAYTDIGFQEDDPARNWILGQKRGVMLLQNHSTPGNISFSDISHAALGADIYGTDQSYWDVYCAIPLDYDLDGDFDLFVGANGVRSNNPDLIRFYENVSTPGNMQFIEVTDAAGFQRFNTFSQEDRKELSFASGVPIDYNNDGWVDLAIVNRKSYYKTLDPYVHLFINKGNKQFNEIPYNLHRLGLHAGGRDINYGDLNHDGKPDIILSDGTVGGYYGTDSTLFYQNTSLDSNHWIGLDIRENETWAIGTKVTAFSAETGAIIGYDEIRTDFCYRSKRHPRIHFGLGENKAVVIELKTWDGVQYNLKNLTVDSVHTISLETFIPTHIDNSPNNALKTFLLYENFPNPFNPVTNIRYILVRSGFVTLRIFNIRGEEIETLVTSHQKTGVYQVHWRPVGLPSGIYFCRLQAGEFSETMKIILQK